MAQPSFVRAGSAGLDIARGGGGQFLRFEAGKPVEVVMLHGVEPPAGEDPSGSNSIISFNQYAIWLDDLPEGVKSPVFPALGGKSDPGAMLGLEPRFKGLAIVMEKDGEDEKIWAFTVSIFKQLVEIEAAMGESLRGKVLRVTRTGEGLKTKYRITPTTKSVDIEGEPETNLLDHVGPTTREAIIEMLEAAGQWPPTGGDPFAKGKTLGKAKTKPAPVEDEPADEDFESA